MSLVLEALRRLEKSGGHTAPTGIAVSSYRQKPRGTRVALPLLLGLAAGGVVVFFYGPPLNVPVNRARVNQAITSVREPRPLKGAAGLPPMLVPSDFSFEAVANTVNAESSRAARSGNRQGRVRLPEQTTPPRSVSAPALVLQAISQRDSQPIAVINDQLVKEGDMLGAVKVVKIGVETVEVLLKDGRTDIVRFAPPPEATPEATPAPDRP